MEIIETIKDLRNSIFKINMEVAKQKTLEQAEGFVKKKYKTKEIFSHERYIIAEDKVYIRAVGNTYIEIDLFTEEENNKKIEILNKIQKNGLTNITQNF